MAFDRWRIGMDMEPDVLRALALSRDRAEWRCRGWWQFPLSMARDAQGDPCPVAPIVDALRRLAPPLDFVFGAESAAACHFTRTEPGPVPEGGELWSPFDILRAASERPERPFAPRERRWPRGGRTDGETAPLPGWPAAWVIAAGLALAPKERLWRR
ncbi:MAG: hypothetical protein ACR5LG_04255 [Sodalis sp. (in: enterobacteria)]|uniref:hypothetical protein n=1 Tax=Sodalis sp. (in: enterobacteria) TaxID=1898979 RepID=UPI003F3881F1